MKTVGQKTPSDEQSTSQRTYTSFFKLAAVAAFLFVVLTLAEVILFAVFPAPADISGWYQLFRNSPVIGIINFWGLEILMYVVFIFVFLALYFALEKTGKMRMAVMMLFVVIGAGVFFATNNPIAMLTLSNQFGAAASEAQRQVILAAGQSVLINTGQRAVGGFNIALLLVTISGVIASAAMLKTEGFGKFIGIIGIIGHGFTVADYVRQFVTASALSALILILPGTLLLIIWFILIGVKLMRRAAS